jgi:hypothetical protein
MRYLSTMIGGAICGALCFGIWPEMWKSYGIMGGWITAAIVIGICWYMNHWIGVIRNPPGKLWVDQGWAVAAAGIAWTMVRFNAPILRALPVVLCCLVGGALAGIAAVPVKKHLALVRLQKTSADGGNSDV